MAKKQSWKLDNAALIFPAIQTGSHNMLFRISADFAEEIDQKVLSQALSDVADRFPHFKVRLRVGAFWYYFDPNDNALPLEQDVINPLRRMDFSRQGGYMFRIRYGSHRIAGEFFHSLCDGTTALIFMRTLWARYLYLAGHTEVLPSPEKGILDCNDKISEAELEDAFVKYAERGAGAKRKESKAWHLKGERHSHGNVEYVCFSVDASLLYQKAKEIGVTVNEYVTACIIETLYGIQKNTLSRGEIKVSVPVNMRRYYSTETLRNFSLYTNVGIDPKCGEYDFATIAKEVSAMLKYKLQPKLMSAQMATNVGDERNVAVRAVPLFVKNIVMHTVYLTASENQFTTNYSGLGVVSLTPEMEKYITGMCFMLGAPRCNSSQASGLTYKGRFYLTVTEVLKDKSFRRNLAKCFVEKGFEVQIEDNG